MLKQEYLELIQLTKLFLLPQPPPAKPAPAPKTPPPPLKKPLLKPLAVEKSQTKAKEEEKIEAAATENEILTLLKTYYPKLSLIPPPLEKKQVFLFYHEEMDTEKELLSNLNTALNKAGYHSELLEIAKASELHIKTYHHLLVAQKKTFANSIFLKEHAKKEPSGKVRIGKAKAIVIPSLLELIEYPVKRKDLWSSIIDAFKG